MEKIRAPLDRLSDEEDDLGIKEYYWSISNDSYDDFLKSRVEIERKFESLEKKEEIS